MTTSSVCPNCGTDAPGRYCPDCGQRKGELTPTLREWVGEALGELFGVDAKLPRTLQLLFWPPGELTLEWRRGRRAAYLVPFRLYLAAALVLFLAWPNTGFNAMLEGFTVGWIDAPSAPGGVGAPSSTTVDLGVRVVTQSLPGLLLALFVPFFAVALQVVNRGGVGYVAHLVGALHLHAVTFVVIVLASPLHLLGDTAESGGFLVSVLLLLGYATAFVARVYGVGPWRAFGRTLAVLVIYLAVVIGVVGAVIGIVTQSA